MPEFRNIFSGNPLDREAARRRDESWVTERLDDPDALFLPLRDLTFPMHQVGEGMRLAWSPLPSDADVERHPPLLLGTNDGTARFAIDAAAAPDRFALPEDATFMDLRAAAPVLDADDAGIAAQARSFLDWHQRHGFCAVCGEPTRHVQGGIYRTCTVCPAEHFPRTDPVVITVVIDTERERCLLGRQASWPPGMFSALAGFIDHGESIEDAVRREVAEESGIEAVNVRYHSSQPWPFPSSLMIGCLADAGSSEINYDEWEMDDVQWFTRDEIDHSLGQPAAQLGEPGLPEGALSLPGPMAIAHTLITAWARGDV
ncbi:MAG: NAD(+) diphosphatase [Chloroflexi bacterium]|nr:NAD(+) diphosphatase [Chloroflexota bacterium]MYF22761.1 NAD(+) diphosphatase [Chloroflexota bacterium]